MNWFVLLTPVLEAVVPGIATLAGIALTVFLARVQSRTGIKVSNDQRDNIRAALSRAITAITMELVAKGGRAQDMNFSAIINEAIARVLKSNAGNVNAIKMDHQTLLTVAASQAPAAIMEAGLNPVAVAAAPEVDLHDISGYGIPEGVPVIR